MTVVQGSVVDVSGGPLGGVLWARTGWRGATGVVYAPQAVPWPITAGQVSADLAPGPARLTIDCGPSRRSFDVTIPDEGPVTLASLIGDS